MLNIGSGEALGHPADQALSALSWGFVAKSKQVVKRKSSPSPTEVNFPASKYHRLLWWDFGELDHHSHKLQRIRRDPTSDKPAEYYRMWADRLNLTPQDVATAERLSGKPIAQMSLDDLDKVIMQLHGELVAEEADVDQFSADANLFIAAMRRRGAATMGNLFAMLTPDDDDYAEVNDARKRMETRLRAEADTP